MFISILQMFKLLLRDHNKMFNEIMPKFDLNTNSSIFMADHSMTRPILWSDTCSWAEHNLDPYCGTHFIFVVLLMTYFFLESSCLNNDSDGSWRPYVHKFCMCRHTLTVDRHSSEVISVFSTECFQVRFQEKQSSLDSNQCLVSTWWYVSENFFVE